MRARRRRRASLGQMSALSSSQCRRNGIGPRWCWPMSSGNWSSCAASDDRPSIQRCLVSMVSRCGVGGCTVALADAKCVTVASEYTFRLTNMPHSHRRYYSSLSAPAKCPPMDPHRKQEPVDQTTTHRAKPWHLMTVFSIAFFITYRHTF